MSMLMVEDFVDYNTLKATLEVTDGNLASHIKALEKEQYITFEKSFFERKPLTKYKITPLGKKAFEDHLAVLEEILQQLK